MADTNHTSLKRDELYLQDNEEFYRRVMLAAYYLEREALDGYTRSLAVCALNGHSKEAIDAIDAECRPGDA